MGERVLRKQHKPYQFPTRSFVHQIARNNSLQEVFEKSLLWRISFVWECMTEQSWLFLMKGQTESEVQLYPSLPSFSQQHAGNAATICYKKLASMIATKHDQPYSSTMSWLRCTLPFALLRSSIQCIRGSHSAARHAMKQQLPSIDLVRSETCLET